MNFESSQKTRAIAEVLRALPLGGSMTYERLSECVGFPVRSQTPAYRGAIKIVLREGVSIAAHEINTSFRRRNSDEMAEGRHRFGSIRRTAKRGSYEAKEALRSNDLRTQAKASIAAAKYAVLTATKPVSNKDVPNDRI